MLTVSPNGVSTFARCPAAAGYSYVHGDKRSSRLPAIRRGVNRGNAIHGATLGGDPTEQTLPGMEGDGPVPAPYPRYAPPAAAPTPAVDPQAEYYHPIIAEADARMIWAVIDRLWPGYVWRKEETLYTMLTPGIKLNGRLDLWGQGPNGVWDILDLKTSTAFTTNVLDGRSDELDKQLILYARLVHDNLTNGTITGNRMPGLALPRIWRLGFNPTTKRPHRRQYLLSDELITQVSRYAVHVACSIERMQLEHPLEWLRSMACVHPFPCVYKPQCARDTGAWYTDGCTAAPMDSPTSDAKAWDAPIPVAALVRGPMLKKP